MARASRSPAPSVFTAAFAALIAVSGFIAIPVGPVPIVLQNMMVVLAALILAGARGAAAVGLYIIAGLLGLPVFAGGGSGIASLAAPSGGFIAGYFAGSLAAGIFLGAPKARREGGAAREAVRVTLAALICEAVLYAFGIAHLMRVLDMRLPQALAAGLFPFIPADAAKLAVAVPLAVKLRPVAARYLSPGDAADE